jgi:hypothetical protein
MVPQSFVLSIPDAAIIDLTKRLDVTRFPDAAPGEPWAYGTSVDYARDLVAYWKDHFDWRVQESIRKNSKSFVRRSRSVHSMAQSPAAGHIWIRPALSLLKSDDLPRY